MPNGVPHRRRHGASDNSPVWQVETRVLPANRPIRRQPIGNRWLRADQGSRSGPILFDSLTKLKKVTQGVLKRAKKCIPPIGAKQYVNRKVGEEDATKWGMQMYRPEFHTGGNESQHARIVNIIGSDTPGERLASALFLEATIGPNLSSRKAHGFIVAGTDKAWLLELVNDAVRGDEIFGAAAVKAPCSHLPPKAAPRPDINPDRLCDYGGGVVHEEDVLGAPMTGKLSGKAGRKRSQLIKTAEPMPKPAISASPAPRCPAIFATPASPCHLKKRSPL